MKKLLGLLVLGLFISCGNDSYSSIENKNIVERIKKHSYSEGCSYYGKAEPTGICSSTSFRLIDTCGKFNIGDTIILTK